MGDPTQGMVLGALGCAALGALISLLARANPPRCVALGYGAAALSGLLAALSGLRILFGAHAQRLDLFAVLPGDDLAVRLTALAAFFWVVIGLASSAVSIFAIGYARQYASRVSLGWLGAAFNLFLLSMLVVTAADDALGFLIAWETMAVLSYLLVVYDHHDRSVVRAGLLYAVMTHAGTACIALCFLLLAAATPGTVLNFTALHVAAIQLQPGRASAAFLLALVGFGTKAGVMPFHVWLPRAHPVAPSHVSALMSGVMIKTGIYGMVLVWFEFLPAGPLWWGLLVLALGAVSAFLGVVYALMQHDLKRLLAYHSVENIGIILLALGAALLLRSSGQDRLAALALAAGLFHTLNHAMFKSLLFMGAGAVQHAAHSRDLERLGGLLRRMPWTGMCFLIGAAAISALPPLNGFASEWLVYQSLLAVGLHVGAGGVGGAALLAGAALALTGALAAACFVKAMGIAFLGQPRSPGAADAVEASLPERLGTGTLAAACLVLGLLTPLVLRALDPVTTQLIGFNALGGTEGQRQPSWWQAVEAPGTLGHSAIQPLALLLALASVVVLGVVLTTALRRRRAPARAGKTWNCGVALTPRMQYSATSFAQPIRRMFSAVIWPDRVVTKEYAHEPYFVTAISYEVSFKPLFDRFLYAPIRGVFLRSVAIVRLAQNGSVHAYLAYVFVALIVTLAVIR
ncbi:MAG TPA: hydrogenase 4 subunit B [Chloroflexota bacterium]